jgi:hypothetical protein
VVLQQTTRQLWASQGPFEPYTVHRVPQQNIPDDYIKTAVWKTNIVPNRYYAQSSAPEESGIPSWYPVEFNPEHICWVEVRWAEPAGSEGYWQAFRIMGEDLGLDITQEEVECHIARTLGINNYRESTASSPTTRASTPSEPSIIRPRASPYQPGSHDQEIAQTLAESLNIREMSHTLTIPVPVGTIDPHTGHINEDDVTLYQAIGPDQADPPSTTGRRSDPPQIPFGWVRPPMGGPPGGFPGGGSAPGGGGFPGGFLGGGGFPGGGGPPTPVPLPPAPVIPGRRGDKLVGNPPLIFKGDWDKAEEFITQWQLYKGVNITNNLMRNAYQ